MSRDDVQARKRAIETLRVLLTEDETNPRKGHIFYCYNMHAGAIALEDISAMDSIWGHKIGIFKVSDETDGEIVKVPSGSQWPRCTKCYRMIRMGRWGHD